MFGRDLLRKQRLKLFRHLDCLFRMAVASCFHIKLYNVGVFLKNVTNNVQTKLKLPEVRFRAILKSMNNVLIFRNDFCVSANAHVLAKDFIRNILKYVSQTKSIQDP